MLLSLGLGSLAFAQQTTTEPKADEPRVPAERREQRIENRDDRQDNRQDDRQDARGDRRENRDVRQDDRQADDDQRQENRQARRDQLRERLANQLDQDGRRPIESIFVLVDRIVDQAAGADVASASLPQVQETYALLRQFDRDNNGTITHEELVAGQAMARQQRTAGAIARLDTDKDGKLSQQEATAGQFTGTFEQLDKNKDGFLDRDEVTASYTAMRDRLGIRRDGDTTAPATTPRPTNTPEQPKD
jgi:hypothetical protein